MPRVSYGPEVKRRTKRLLEALLIYTKCEWQDCKDYKRKDIEINWQSDNRLVVRTTTSFLEHLTAEDQYNGRLTRDQIQESLRRLRDLKLLEDNRTTTQGSQIWHFTLNLWSEDQEKNLREFDVQWEERKPKNLAMHLSFSRRQQKLADEALPFISPTKKSLDGTTVSVVKPELPGGQVFMDSTFYVERPPIEERCYKEIKKPGALLRIKAPSLMGKTFLINKIFERVARENYRTVSLSFKLAEQVHFTNLDELLRWLCSTVSEELQLPNQLDCYWDKEKIGSKLSCTKYFKEYLLAQTDSPLALCLDDVDWVFPYPEISEDFFALLRFWHEKARSHDIWRKLRLVIVHSTDVYIKLNINQSPFNVGLPIELSEFTSEQVQNLAKQYCIDWNATQVEQLKNMVGGHPYLVQQTFSYLKENQNITLLQFLETAHTESGIYSHHLREQLLEVQKRPELIAALKKVVTATTSVRLESTQAYQLYSRGLVKRQGNEVEPRCNLYRQYFCDRLEDT